MLAPVSKVEDLSFSTGKKNLWSPRRTGNYADDTAMGRQYADELLAHMRLKECPLAFGQVMRAITESGTYDAVEIGFCSRLGIHILTRSPMAQENAFVNVVQERGNIRSTIEA